MHFAANNNDNSPRTLLSPSDPEPVEIVNVNGSSEVFLLCEHAGHALPSRLADLGLSAADMDKHIAWDIGAEGVARRLSELLNAPLVLQRYSRLVIDTNRPLAARDCIPTISDGIEVPGNKGISKSDRQQRYDEIHRPLHDAVSTLLDKRANGGRPGVLVTIHSFTPVLGEQRRDFSVGLLFNRDRRLADALSTELQKIVQNHTVRLNAPYSVDDESDYAIPVHGEGRGLPSVLLELRNDLIGNISGQNAWAKRVNDALAKALVVLETSA